MNRAARLRLGILLSFCLSTVLTTLQVQGQELEVPSLPLGSKWKFLQEGDKATLLRAGRIKGATAWLIEGKGADLLNYDDFGLQQADNYSFPRCITARLVSLSGAAGRMAGIGLVAEFGANDRYGIRVAYRADGTLLLTDYKNGGLSPKVVATGLSLPLWLRIDYRGGYFAPSYSVDGKLWKYIDGFGATFPPARFQLVASSGIGQDSTLAVFDQVWMTGGDADDNQIPDGWEMLHFGHLLGTDAGADPDFDTLTNAQEWIFQTNPLLADLPPQVDCQLSEDKTGLIFLKPAYFFADALERSRDLIRWEIVPYGETTNYFDSALQKGVTRLAAPAGGPWFFRFETRPRVQDDSPDWD